jgi:universal stress protein A
MLGYRKILVIVDLSNGSDSVVRAAREQAAYSHASIVALHVVEFVPVEPMGDPLMPTLSMEPTLAIEAELIDRATEKLRTILAAEGLSETPMRIEAGSIKGQIVRVAEEEKPDLMVVGSHERHGLAVLLNFTDDAVLHAAHCDVLAVRLR